MSTNSNPPANQPRARAVRAACTASSVLPIPPIPPTALTSTTPPGPGTAPPTGGAGARISSRAVTSWVRPVNDAEAAGNPAIAGVICAGR
ncbi:hypothetical protein OG589_13000 [Sphaerisporangium sp. NBC_01403]|uniref:hypothetical protein n=1 Tax=Sphaerisporangium sp. NBC_01403 TaxID=2903599 RepID=UPI003244783C